MGIVLQFNFEIIQYRCYKEIKIFYMYIHILMHFSPQIIVSTKVKINA